MKKQEEELARLKKQAQEAEAQKLKDEAAATPAQKANEGPTLSAADRAKQDKQRPKVEAVLKKVEAKKTTAADAFKLGQYGEAIQSYKAAVQVLESAGEDFPLFKREIAQMEATIFNNMAACCRKELNSKAEVEYSTKVIDRAEHVSDKTVLLKAFLRRGLAYEQMEKYLQAKEDMLSVKELQFDNKQASQCLNRVQKAIKDIYGDKVPEVQKNKQIKMASAPATTTESAPAKAAPSGTPSSTK